MKVEQGSKEDLLIGHHIGLTLCLDTPSWINQRKSLAAKMLGKVISRFLKTQLGASEVAMP